MCLSPVMLKKNTPRQIVADKFKMQQVPCGKCVLCMKRRVNSWHARLTQQLKVSTSACFITLTYDENALPFSDNGLMTLDYKDFSRSFMDKLRNMQRKQKEKIKYFCAGEYGEKTYRPHFHAIMFNVADRQNVVDSWQHGFAHVGDVTDASMYYTLKYCIKRSFMPWNVDPDDDRKPQKAVMSKGLGLNYLDSKEVQRYHLDDLTRGMPLIGNKVIGLPRYYRDKLYDDSQKIRRNTMLSVHDEKRLEQKEDSLYTQRVQRMNLKEKLKLTKTD